MTLSVVNNPPAYCPAGVFGAGVGDGVSSWVALRTKARHEKALAWNLNNRGIGYYLPLLGRPQKSKDRVRYSLCPLFDGYVFLRGSADDRRLAQQTGLVVQVLRVADQERFGRELRGIITAIAARPVALCRPPTAGQRVQIVRGPLAGLEGVVLRSRGCQRLVLQLAGIQQAIRLDLSVDDVLA